MKKVGQNSANLRFIWFFHINNHYKIVFRKARNLSAYLVYIFEFSVFWEGKQFKGHPHCVMWSGHTASRSKRGRSTHILQVVHRDNRESRRQEAKKSCWGPLKWISSSFWLQVLKLCGKKRKTILDIPFYCFHPLWAFVGFHFKSFTRMWHTLRDVFISIGSMITA